jgi:hypothetical protein
MSTTASGLTDVAAQGLLGAFLGGATLSPAKPAGFWLGVSTTNTTAAGGITEPVGNGYARVSVGSAFNTPSGSGTVSCANTNAIQFAVSTGSWGTILGWILFDALTSGNGWSFGQLASGISIPSGRVLSFAAGEIVNQMISATGPFTGFTDYAATQLLKGLFKVVSFGLPSNWYLGVSTTNATAAGGFTEPVGNGYARLQIPANATNWPTAGTGTTVVSIAQKLALQMATLTGTWGTLISWALFDALTSGNMWFAAPISPSLVPATGEAPYVPANTLSIVATSTS